MKYLKPVLALLWLSLFSVFAWLWYTSGIALTETPEVINSWLQEFGLINAALIYVVIYTLRPLLFFPASILTLTSGLVFGPWLGILFTIIGENFSANFAFLIARWFGRSWISSKEQGSILEWEERIQRNGFLTVLFMRLIYLPFDAVNYGCGLTSIKQRDYALATLIGIMPGLVTFVLLGGAAAANTENRMLVLGGSFACFLFGLLIAKRLRSQQVNPAN